MYRLFTNSRNSSNGRFTICDKEQVHHIKDVLRLKVNEMAAIVDEKGKRHVSSIEKITSQYVIFKIKEAAKVAGPEAVKVSIACAIPKKSKMDDIIDMLTQLGVTRIIPLSTERVIVKLDDRKKNLRKERWEKIALSSASQSQRDTVPVIEPIKNMEEALRESKGLDLKLIATLTDERRPLREVLNDLRPRDIIVFIGPEGDFTPQEIDLAKKAGCIPVSLGNTVLRVDNAAVSAASFIMLYENS